jgi:hypothetical protein
VRPIARHTLALPLLLLAVAAPAVAFWVSPAAAVALVALTVLEIAMAADSSVPMAGIASRIHRPARRLFLSVGLVAGVLAMRLVLPPAAVAVTQVESPTQAATDAILRPGLFTEQLSSARPGIAAFGALFIWLVFAEYLFDVDRSGRRAWLGRFEAAAARVRLPKTTAVLVGLGLAAGATALAEPGSRVAVGVGGGVGVIAYLGSKAVAAWARGQDAPAWRLHVHAATVVFERGLTVFMLFEILDGVYTLAPADGETSDGVGYVGQALIAALGVGIGAVFLARLTVTVDSGRGLVRLRYLKAGAAYVLGVLSVLLWASLAVPIPGVVAGWFGSVIIGAALVTSLPRRRRGSGRSAPRDRVGTT